MCLLSVQLYNPWHFVKKFNERILNFYNNFMFLYYSTESIVKFAKNGKVRILHFYIFLIYIHVFMLCRKFELVPIKIRFFTNF